MITQVKIENIGPLFKKNEFVFKPGINIVRGENAAGKSTLLRAIEMTVNDSKDYMQMTYPQLSKGANKGEIVVALSDGTDYILSLTQNSRIRKPADSQISISSISNDIHSHPEIPRAIAVFMNLDMLLNYSKPVLLIDDALDELDDTHLNLFIKNAKKKNVQIIATSRKWDIGNVVRLKNK